MSDLAAQDIKTIQLVTEHSCRFQSLNSHTLIFEHFRRTCGSSVWTARRSRAICWVCVGQWTRYSRPSSWCWFCRDHLQTILLGWGSLILEVPSGSFGLWCFHVGSLKLWGCNEFDATLGSSSSWCWVVYGGLKGAHLPEVMPYDLCIKNSQQNILVLTVEETDSIRDLKQDIKARISDVQDEPLFFNGVELADEDATLLEYNILPDDCPGGPVVHLGRCQRSFNLPCHLPSGGLIQEHVTPETTVGQLKGRITSEVGMYAWKVKARKSKSLSQCLSLDVISWFFFERILTTSFLMILKHTHFCFYTPSLSLQVGIPYLCMKLFAGPVELRDPLPLCRYGLAGDVAVQVRTTRPLYAGPAAWSSWPGMSSKVEKEPEKLKKKGLALELWK